jgi:putative nucleotidyltransferase with HDIG domain
MGALRRLWRINRGLLVLLGIVAGTGLINFFVINQRAFLNFYYLPVVFGAYTLGVRRGVYSAVLASAIVFGIAWMNDQHFVAGADVWMRWIDLGTWAGFLVLTAFVVGSLHEQKDSQMKELQQAYKGILELMGKFIDSADRYTENHSRRVAEYAVAVARSLKLSEEEVEDVRVGAYLHDVGKVDVSADVLRKAAGLSDDEMQEMQRHVDHGVQMVRSVGGILRNVIPMVAFHHERWDGTGYKCIQGDAIPIGARIIAVADTYDAIVTDRPYRAGRTHEQALAVLREESGRQFDPRVVRAFLALYAASPPAAAETRDIEQKAA